MFVVLDTKNQIICGFNAVLPNEETRDGSIGPYVNVNAFAVASYKGFDAVVVPVHQIRGRELTTSRVTMFREGVAIETFDSRRTLLTRIRNSLPVSKQSRIENELKELSYLQGDLPGNTPIRLIACANGKLYGSYINNGLFANHTLSSVTLRSQTLLDMVKSLFSDEEVRAFEQIFSDARVVEYIPTSNPALPTDTRDLLISSSILAEVVTGAGSTIRDLLDHLDLLRSNLRRDFPKDLELTVHRGPYDHSLIEHLSWRKKSAIVMCLYAGTLSTTMIAGVKYQQMPFLTFAEQCERPADISDADGSVSVRVGADTFTFTGMQAEVLDAWFSLNPTERHLVKQLYMVITETVGHRLFSEKGWAHEAIAMWQGLDHVVGGFYAASSS